MPLQTSGQMTTDEIMTELGETGQFVTNSASALALAGVGSGQLIIPGDFYGKGNDVLAEFPADFSVISNTIAPTDSIATVTMKTNGDITFTVSGTAEIVKGNWLSDLTDFDPTRWECRATLVSNSLPTNGTMTIWRRLDLVSEWDIIRTSNSGTSISVIDISVRDVNDASNLATVRVTLRATVSPDL